jgi:hypothetical protein
MASVSDSNVKRCSPFRILGLLWNHYVRLLGKLKMSRWTTSTVG